MNGYDAICEAAKASRTTRMPEAATIPATPVRPPGAYSEAAATKRSDGKSSQDKNGGNRYDTSTPEKRRKALAAARRSDNPEDLKRLRGKVAESCLLPQIYPREAVSSGDFPGLEEAPLNAKRRKALPKTAFALPGERAYPIDTPARARAALARVEQFGTPEEIKKVKAAVRKRFPDMEVT